MFTRTKTALSAAIVLVVLGTAPAVLAGNTREEGAQAQVEVGTGILCDTQKQMERFVALFQADAEAAVNAVNAEEDDPNACAVGTMAYVRGPEIATVRTQNATFKIFRVLVVGMFTDSGLRATVPVTFFSVDRVDERTA
jgi:hypothetical protein